jgi:hypothetical protein
MFDINFKNSDYTFHMLDVCLQADGGITTTTTTNLNLVLCQSVPNSWGLTYPQKRDPLKDEFIDIRLETFSSTTFARLAGALKLNWSLF